MNKNYHRLLLALICPAWILPLGCSDTAEPADSGVVVDQKLVDMAGPDAGVDQVVPDAKNFYADWLESGDLWSCDAKTLAAEALAKGTKILKGVTVTTKSTSLEEIAKNPDSFNGLLIRAEGVITEVCSSQGCYVKIRGPKGNWLVLKVEDGTVDFRKLAKVGQYAVGEGTYMSMGGHGPMVYIQKHGAMIGSTICKAQ